MTVHQSIVSLAKVMYLGAMWRWGRVGDILADVLSYRSSVVVVVVEKGYCSTDMRVMVV